MANIVLCDPIISLHAKHLPHLMEFYAANKAKHELVLHMRIGRPLHRVQQEAVHVAREISASHVLFTEHDHWAYPINALDKLLETEERVVGLQTYQRSYPFLPMNMRKVHPEVSFLVRERNLRSFYPTERVQPTDLITWAFTLVRLDVFDEIEAARKEGKLTGTADEEPWVWDQVPTDSHFCQACEDLDIERKVYSGLTQNEGALVNHGDIEPAHLIYWRRMTEAIYAAAGKFPRDAMPPAPEDHGDEQLHEREAERAIQEAAG